MPETSSKLSTLGNLLVKRRPVTCCLIYARMRSDCFGHNRNSTFCGKIHYRFLYGHTYIHLLLRRMTAKYTVFQKSDAKIQITITTAYRIRIKYPLSGFNYHLSDVNVANFNKIHLTVSEQQVF